MQRTENFLKYGDLSIGVTFDKDRNSDFSYKCAACNNCCRGKAIRVGPYEVLRLARHLGVTTTEFIEIHTQSGGTVLRTDAQGDCGFLNEKGCSVHSERPLACRLYPLGMTVLEDGAEQFGELFPHPLSQGKYGKQSKLSDYLEQQGALPYIEANKIYEELYSFLVTMLERISPEELQKREGNRRAADGLGIGTLVSLWIDIDACLKNSSNEFKVGSTTFESKILMHVNEVKRLATLIENDFMLDQTTGEDLSARQAADAPAAEAQGE
jgi:uncharacterized protein